MDATTLRQSATPPEGASGPLHALWHAARGDWDKAHAIVQDDASAAAAWVHAHLHRQEGDLGNAAYWYEKAGRPMPDQPIEDEWTEIASAMAMHR